MQYETVSRKARAQQHRRDARECDHAGFQDFAAINWELAEMLDPTPRPKRELTRAPRDKRPSKGPDLSRANGQRDAPPRMAFR
jgi:hypothetical protein